MKRRNASVGARLERIGLVALMSLCMLLVACGRGVDTGAADAMKFAYPDGLKNACLARAPAQGAAGPVSRVTDGKLSYLVRTPENYDSRFAHPLLVVYAAAGARAERTEQYTKLTAPATERGFIIAYVDHRPMAKSNVLTLGGIASSVAGRWCIDPQRVFLAGHSDGGTVSTALSLLPETRSAVQGIAVSAAGFRQQDLEDLQCRTPIPVMVMHGTQDKLFPGWGRDAARWWAQCNKCKQPAGPPDASGCVSYSGCAPGAPVLYCEGPRSHTEWPPLQSRMIDFLLDSNHARPEQRGGTQ